MKKFAISLVSVLGLLILAQAIQADGPHSYGGQQPWWNIFARRPKLNPEEERLQRFWHDYYNSLGRYYNTLDRIDWVAYYKNHGYQINTGGSAGCYPMGGGSGSPNNRIQFAPVQVSPGIQWAMPNSAMSGAPSGPSAPPPGAFTPGYGPSTGGPPPGYGGPPPGYGGGGPPPGYGGPPPGYGGPPPGYGGPPPGYGGGPPPGYGGGGPPPGYGGPPPGYGPVGYNPYYNNYGGYNGSFATGGNNQVTQVGYYTN